jgi:hypothetical protein
MAFCELYEPDVQHGPNKAAAGREKSGDRDLRLQLSLGYFV